MGDNRITEAFASSSMRLLQFDVQSDEGSLQFAVNTQKIREVVESSGVTKLPAKYLPFVGMLDLRGVPVPVLSIARLVNNGPSSEALEEGKGRIIICEIGNRLTGLLVSQRVKIIVAEDKDIFAPDLTTNTQLSEDFINAVIRDSDGAYIFMLGIEDILDQRLSTRDNLSSGADLQPESTLIGCRALVVEDSPIMQKKMHKLLTSFGLTVIQAFDGQEGLDKAHQHEFDLVISDVEMPKMNGIMFVKNLKKEAKYSNIPVIFHSSISNENLIQEIQNENLGRYVVKLDEAKLKQILLETMSCD